MAAAEEFERHRAFLTGLGYRMLGSVQDAEDVVQETWLRWQRDGAPDLQAPRAWFTRTATRLCVDRLRGRRPEYPGEWLPEPWVEADRHERDDTLSAALLLTLRRLSPTERAVFLLHDVFDHTFDEVAAMLELEPANCRQLAARARRHLRERPPREPDAARERELGAAFFRALQDGDLDALQGLLRDDVVLRADGGGKATAVHYPLRGRDAVVRFFDRLLVRTGAIGRARIEPTWFNAAPGFLMFAGDDLESAYQFDCVDGAVQQVLVHRNPDKLAKLTARR